MSNAAFTTFVGPCVYCDARNFEMSIAGPSCCRKCYGALDLIGQRPFGISSEDFRILVLEMAAVVRALPQAPNEQFRDYKPRVIMAVNVMRKGQMLPPYLFVPLSPD